MRRPIEQVGEIIHAAFWVAIMYAAMAYPV